MLMNMYTRREEAIQKEGTVSTKPSILHLSSAPTNFYTNHTHICEFLVLGYRIHWEENKKYIKTYKGFLAW